MEILNYIMPPLVGAVIGYFTNYIAVKMLFRPLKPVIICGKKLPFTPGIIPKGKPRLAKALGQAVSQSLFTENDIKNILISEQMQNTVGGYIEKILKSTSSIKESAENLITPEKYSNLKDVISDKLTEKIMNAIAENDIGNIIAEKGKDAIKEKVAGSMLAMFVHDELIDSLCKSLGSKVNEYIDTNGEAMVSVAVDKEIIKLENQSIYALLTENGADIDEIINSVKKAYVNFIDKNAEKFIGNFNISDIVEEKVNAMDVLMVEELLMSIMKKELNAVVNLGAVIGLILGMVNIFF